MTNQLVRLDLESPDLAAGRRAALADLFPGVLTDGVLDADRLAEMLDVDVASARAGRERFGLMWAGRQESVRSLLTPGRGTLVPNLADSVDFDDATDIFIEGDNLEVLKLLQKAYNERVKLIFIDPPYNTGHDFVYADDFHDGLREYLRFTGQLDDDGNRRSAAAEVHGRRHSRWLGMMHPRLMLARNLLCQDGAIFVSIDDHESAHLRCLMDEVFGPENFLANIAWKHTQQSKNDEPYFSRHWNSLLAYRRSPELKGFTLPRTEAHDRAYRNPDDDPRGPWRSGDVRSPSPRPTLRFPIPAPSGGAIDPPANGWRWSLETVRQKIATGEIIFNADETGIVRKIYLADQGGRTPENVWDGPEVGVTRDANREIQDIFGRTVFDTPKPTGLIRRILQLATPAGADDVVLDFFAGSGSTAHAVVAQNAEDGGHRRVISINVPEPTAPESEAARAGYPTVSAITLARIKAVRPPDAGLRVFRLAPSNFRTRQVADGELFDLSATTLVQADVDWESVAAEVLLKEGVPLDAPWERHEIDGTPVVVAGRVAVVLTTSISHDAARGALALKPRTVVFCEDGFSGADPVKVNTFTNARAAGVTMKTV